MEDLHRDTEQEQDLLEIEEERKEYIRVKDELYRIAVEQRDLAETELKFVKYENQRLRDQIEQLVHALEK